MPRMYYQFNALCSYLEHLQSDECLLNDFTIIHCVLAMAKIMVRVCSSDELHHIIVFVIISNYSLIIVLTKNSVSVNCHTGDQTKNWDFTTVVFVQVMSRLSRHFFICTYCSSSWICGWGCWGEVIVLFYVAWLQLGFTQRDKAYNLQDRVSPKFKYLICLGIWKVI